MVLDLKQEKGKEILRQLIAVSDIVVENYRPTTMRKLGFGWDELRKINPRIIYCSISGFGQDTLPEYAERPSYDMVAQAYSGIMSITGTRGGSSLPRRLLGRRHHRRNAGGSGHPCCPCVSGEDGTGAASGHVDDRRAVRHPRKRRRPVHDQRGDPRAAGGDPSLDHPLPGVSDGGFLDHRGCRDGPVVRQVLLGHRPGGSERRPPVRDQPR